MNKWLTWWKLEKQPSEVSHGGVSAFIAGGLTSIGAQLASGLRRVADSINQGDNQVKLAGSTPVTVGEIVEVPIHIYTFLYIYTWISSLFSNLASDDGEHHVYGLILYSDCKLKWMRWEGLTRSDKVRVWCFFLEKKGLFGKVLFLKELSRISFTCKKRLGTQTSKDLLRLGNPLKLFDAFGC